MQAKEQACSDSDIALTIFGEEPRMLDVFRDNGTLRTIGLSYAIAEALSYADMPTDSLNTISCVYVLSHAAYKGFKARSGHIAMSTIFDTLIFDGFATILFPRLVVRSVCRLTGVFLQDISGVPEVIKTWGPTVAGLSALLLCFPMIDWEVSNVMNETVRKLY